MDHFKSETNHEEFLFTISIKGLDFYLILTHFKLISNDLRNDNNNQIINPYPNIVFSLLQNLFQEPPTTTDEKI